MGGAAAAPRGKRPAGGPVPDAEENRTGRGEARIEDALADVVVAAVRDTGGYGGAVYLRSRDRRSLVLCVMSGVPRSLLKPWWRIPVSGALPMCEAFRSGEASVVAPFEYSALAWGLGLDWLVWRTLPDTWTFVGAGIVVASGLYLIHRERLRGGEPPVAVPD